MGVFKRGARWSCVGACRKKRVWIGSFADEPSARLLDDAIRRIDCSWPSVDPLIVQIVWALAPESVPRLEQLLGGSLSLEVIEQLAERSRWALTDELVRRARADALREIKRRDDKCRELQLEYPHRHPCAYPAVPGPNRRITRTGHRMPKYSGVYFAWLKGVIVYVGQSVNLRSRLKWSHDKLLAAQWVSWLPFAESDLDFAEAFYIGLCRPPWNFRPRPLDVEITAGLEDRGREDVA